MKYEKFTLNDDGIYYCSTTNELTGQLENTGFKLTVDDYGKVNLNKLDNSFQFEAPNKNPHAQISILDKASLLRSESVKLYCTTGIFAID